MNGSRSWVCLINWPVSGSVFKKKWPVNVDPTKHTGKGNVSVPSFHVYKLRQFLFVSFLPSLPLSYCWTFTLFWDRIFMWMEAASKPVLILLAEAVVCRDPPHIQLGYQHASEHLFALLFNTIPMHKQRIICREKHSRLSLNNWKINQK